MVAPADADGRHLGMRGHFDVEGGIADHHCFVWGDLEVGAQVEENVGIGFSGPIVGGFCVDKERFELVDFHGVLKSASALSGGDGKEHALFMQRFEDFSCVGVERRLIFPAFAMFSVAGGVGVGDGIDLRIASLGQ